MTLAPVHNCSDDCELTHCKSCGCHIIGNCVDLERNGGMCDGCRWREDEADKERWACSQWLANLRRLGLEDANRAEKLTAAEKALTVLMFNERVVEHLLVNDPQALKQAQEALTGTSFKS